MSHERPDPEADPRWELVRAAARRRVPTPPDLVERVLRSVAEERDDETAPDNEDVDPD